MSATLVAQLEAEIKAREKDYVVKCRLKDSLAEQASMLRSEAEEVLEKHARIRGRLNQARRETTAKDLETSELQEELKRRETTPEEKERSLNEQGAGGGEGAQIAPLDGLEVLMQQVTELKGQIEGEPARAGAGAAASASASEHAALTVAVFFRAADARNVFRITPQYTFRQLRSDTCQFWGVDAGLGTLTDSDGALWPPQATVQQLLAETVGSSGAAPSVEFRVRVPRTAAAAAAATAAGGDGSSGQSSAATKGTAANASGGSGGSGGLRLGWGRKDRYKKVGDSLDQFKAEVVKARRRAASRLSTFFHEVRVVERLNMAATEGDDSNYALTEAAWTFGLLLLHIAFLTALLLGVLTREQVANTHDFRSSLRTALTLETFPTVNGTTTFNRMRSHADMFAFMSGPLLDTLFPQFSAAGAVLPLEKRTHVLEYSRLVGGIRLRQYRVTPTSCTVWPTLVHLRHDTCFLDYTAERTDKAPFGPGRHYAGFNWTKGNPMNSARVDSDIAFYNRNAYALELPMERSKAEARLAVLRRQRWLRDATKAVVIEFNVANLNYNSLCSVQLLAQYNQGGTIVSHSRFQVFRLSFYDYNAANLPLLVVVDIYCFLYVALNLALASTKLGLHGPELFFGTLWNLLDVILFIFVCLLSVLRIYFDWEVGAYFDIQVPHYLQFEEYSNLTENIYNLQALTVFLAVCNTLRFWQANFKISRVFQTLALASSTLGVYFFVFFLMLLGFVFNGHFSWGASMIHFSTPQRSLAEAMAMIRGNVNYEAMREEDAILAAVYFLLFLISMFFVMVNVFLSIVNEAHRTANMLGTEEEQHFWGDLVKSPYRLLKKRLLGH